MKRKHACLIIALALFAFLLSAGFGAPYVRHPILVTIDGEPLTGREVLTDAMHHLKAQAAGGYLPLYEKLRKKYGAKEALNYLGRGLGDYLAAACDKRKEDPLDATLDRTKKKSVPFIYYKERAGRAVDLDRLGKAVARALDKGGAVNVFSEEVLPKVTLADLRERTALIARFTTSFRTSGAHRRHNIALAARAIDGYALLSGETFSFNAVVGERTEERGFESANIILNGDFVKGVGGGVCQVSTTLYNAVLLAGLTPTRASAHSRPVGYVDYARDCTVSDAIDFTFKNDTPYPLYIVADLGEDSLTFRLYGERKAGKYELKSDVLQYVPFRALDEKGSPLSDLTDRTLLKEGREGVRSALYRIHTLDGVSTTTLVRESYYPPQDAVYSARKQSA
ncbi:MAG: VanW family protein [Clostridia bacterium]|nr:VanW family protein [Clostridia bacterium]